MDANFRPVLEVDVITEGGFLGRGSSPTGTSVGKYESFVLRDNDPDFFEGLSVYKAIDNVDKIIAPSLIGMDILDQVSIDKKMIELDGTSNKSNLGGNTIYSVSIACLKAASRTFNTFLYDYLTTSEIKSLPLPTCNSIILGGHGKNASFQEFTFCPFGANNMTEAIEIITNVDKEVGKVIAQFQRGREAERGKGHGWIPPFTDPEKVLSIIHEAVLNCGYEKKVAYALDCASSELYDKKTQKYCLNGDLLNRSEMINLIKDLTEKYNILFVEDILEENDWDGYIQASKEITKTMLIGDDLTTTNPLLIKKAFELQAVKGFIFKPNQIGTVSEALDAHRYAKTHGMLTIPSHRGGGTIWDDVMEIGIGIGAQAAKSCAPRGGESIWALNWMYRASDENPQARIYDFSKYVNFE